MNMIYTLFYKCYEEEQLKIVQIWNLNKQSLIPINVKDMIKLLICRFY